MGMRNPPLSRRPPPYGRPLSSLPNACSSHTAGSTLGECVRSEPSMYRRRRRRRRRGVDVLAPHEEVGRLRDRVALGFGDEADARHGEVAPHDERRERAGDDVHRAGRDEAPDQVLREGRGRTPRRFARPRGSRRARASMKSSVSVERPCIRAVAIRRSSSTSASSGRQLLEVLDEDCRGRPSVEAQVDEAGLGRRGGAVVVDDREDLDALGVRRAPGRARARRRARGSRPCRRP